jgi:hypothetical protein
VDSYSPSEDEAVAAATKRSERVAAPSVADKLTASVAAAAIARAASAAKKSEKPRKDGSRDKSADDRKHRRNSSSSAKRADEKRRDHSRSKRADEDSADAAAPPPAPRPSALDRIRQQNPDMLAALRAKLNPGAAPSHASADIAERIRKNTRRPAPTRPSQSRQPAQDRLERSRAADQEEQRRRTSRSPSPSPSPPAAAPQEPPQAADFQPLPERTGTPNYAAATMQSHVTHGGAALIHQVRFQIAYFGQGPDPSSTVVKRVGLDKPKKLTELLPMLAPTSFLVKRLATAEINALWGRDRETAVARLKRGGLPIGGTTDVSVVFPGHHGALDEEVHYQLALMEPEAIRLGRVRASKTELQREVVVRCYVHASLFHWNEDARTLSHQRADQLIDEVIASDGDMTALVAMHQFLNGEMTEDDAINAVKQSYAQRRVEVHRLRRESRSASFEPPHASRSEEEARLIRYGRRDEHREDRRGDRRGDHSSDRRAGRREDRRDDRRPADRLPAAPGRPLALYRAGISDRRRGPYDQ